MALLALSLTRIVGALPVVDGERALPPDYLVKNYPEGVDIPLAGAGGERGQAQQLGGPPQLAWGTTTTRRRPKQESNDLPWQPELG